MRPSPGQAGPYSHHTEHRIDVAADPDAVYALVSDVTRWPGAFGPTIHAQRLEFDGRDERIQLWATANGEPKTWISRRELLPEQRRVSFRQEVSQSPVAAMRGEWIIEQLPGGGAGVLLTHDYTPVEDVPDAAEWIARAVDRNSEAELASLRAAVEGGDRRGDLELDFEDTVVIDGPLAAVYAFLYEAGEWPVRLPHVSRLELREESAGLQYLEMDTKAVDGNIHTTASIRVCFPQERIVYKQLKLPPLLDLHLGCWTLTATPEGRVTASSRHVIRINPEKVSLLGEGKTVQDAKAFVRNALGTNSTATLNHARAFAEAQARG
ncbi:aromatase/cyclase [Kitasatospora sp. NBC_00315]|uniref:aromatase/cyclase n=1 Tax=Kitasatospora sp. NBC_00315 TaxID=2975963 RepID=UPI003246D25D